MYNRLLHSMETEFYRDNFCNCDDRKLFHLAKELSVPNKCYILPDSNSSSISKQALANKFVEFFEKKIEKLRKDLDTDLINVSHIPARICST